MKPAQQFANTEPSPVSTSLAVAKQGEAAEGPARDGHKPLMRNRARCASPIGSTASDTLSETAPHLVGLNAVLKELQRRLAPN